MKKEKYKSIANFEFSLNLTWKWISVLKGSPRHVAEYEEFPAAVSFIKHTFCSRICSYLWAQCALPWAALSVNMS
jgi:hypothetical protein